MSEKCFCHLNGYKVKDADARAQLSAHDVAIKGLSDGVTEIGQRVDGLEKLYRHTLNINNGLYLTLYNHENTKITVDNAYTKIPTGKYNVILQSFSKSDNSVKSYGSIATDIYSNTNSNTGNPDLVFYMFGVVHDNDFNILAFNTTLTLINNITTIQDNVREV